jgi:hypothetical protein
MAMPEEQNPKTHDTDQTLMAPSATPGPDTDVGAALEQAMNDKGIDRDDLVEPTDD